MAAARWGGKTLRAALLAAAASCLAANPAAAKVLLTQDEALRLALGPDAAVTRRTAFLSGDQLAQARDRAGPGVEIKSALVVWYQAKEGRRAYFDTHRVRTLEETVMIVVEPDATIGRIEVLAFAEPPEYLAKKTWLSQFLGKALGPGLQLKRGIQGMTGATLSSHAVTDAARRVLAIDRVLNERLP